MSLKVENTNKHTPMPPGTTPAELNFDNQRRRIGMICGPICALLVFITPISGLSLEAHKLWLLRHLSLYGGLQNRCLFRHVAHRADTGVVCGVVPAGTAFASFANPMIFLFMGGFMLATAMMMHGLDKRFAFAIYPCPG